VTTDSPGLFATPLDQPIVCPILIGRGPQLDRILRRVAEARTGHGQVILVSGEAGIGKSRLVAEVQAHANQAGARVLQGHCFEPDRTLPYAPLQDLLPALPITQLPHAIIDALGSAAYDLVPLLPNLTDWLPPARRAIALDPEQEKRRLFLALTQLFVRHAAVDPLLVVIEDVHWSDDASLDFITYVARQIEGHPIVLLLTFRTDEIGPRLADLLTELDRSRIASEVRLSRLERADVGAMMRAILGGDRRLPPILLDVIYRLTDGNPFFVEEIVRSLVAEGTSRVGEDEPEWKVVERLRIPRSVDEAVRRRFDTLSPGARQLVTLAAVAGRRFDLPLLQALQGGEERQFLAHLKELLAALLVVEESADRFAFRHALTRQAIYSSLLMLERRAYHQTIAETIEQTHADALDMHLADLSYHTFAAGQWSKALDYGRRAGEIALRLHAAHSAVEHFSRAISAEELFRTSPPSLYGRAGPDSGAPPDLFRRRAQAYEIIGDFEHARADLETALALAQSAGDRRGEWQGLIDLGFLWAERDYAQTGHFYKRASDLAQSLADPLLHARGLNRLGNWLTNVGRAKDALRAHREALALFVAQGDDVGEAETHDLLGMTCGLALGDAIASAEHYDRAIALARALNDTVTLVSSLTARAAVCNPNATETLFSPLTQRDECVAALEEAHSLARHCAWPAALAFAENVLGQALAGYGEFGAALAHAGAGLRIATEIVHQQWQCGAHCMFGKTHVAMLAPTEPSRILKPASLSAARSARPGGSA
jgi:tetratricopeptide (TPR) repeat protein/energy-coupling factor transporter ATP-binding protein EcfA2